MSALTALTMLSLHGNQLQELPQHGWQQLASLKEVTLQGNCLRQIPDSFAQLRVRAVAGGFCSRDNWRTVVLCIRCRCLECGCCSAYIDAEQHATNNSTDGPPVCCRR
jgi:hypothetical protein